MNLTDLPEEILVIIVQKLDLKSVYNLYQSCERLKNIVSMSNVVKTCIMRMNTLATAQSFKLQFIKDISRHLIKLDVGGVLDLTKTSLLGAVKRMKSLKTLDVSYTSLTMEDVIEVYKSCPTIKNITCNFIYVCDKYCRIPKNVLIESQNMFKNFDNINIIGHAGNLLYTDFAIWVMRFANVNELRFTIAESQTPIYIVEDEIEKDFQIVNFKSFNIYVLNDWRMQYPIHSGLYIPTTLKKKKYKGQYEFIIIVMIDCISPQLHVSTMFEKFFIEEFKMKPLCYTDFEQIDYVGNALTMLWKKSDTVFDETFYKNVKIKLLNIFPNCKKDNIVFPDQINNYSLRVPPEKFERSNPFESPSTFKKKRQGAPSQILNFDNDIDTNEKTRLTLYFVDCITCPVVLSKSSQYLKKLTHLSLNGDVIYGFEFFNVLFSCCLHLETLSIETPRSADSISVLLQNINMCPSLKHFRLLDRRIDCNILFSSLSLCKNIENIHIVDMDRENNNLSDPSTLVRNCSNLYFIFLHASMSQTAKERKYRIFKKLKEKFNKPHLHVQLSTMYAESDYCYDPYIDVFWLNPIRPFE